MFLENHPAAGEFLLGNVILKVSQTHFPRISTPRRGKCPLGFAQGGHKFFYGGGGGGEGGVKYPALGEIPTDRRGKRANLTMRSYFSDYHELCSCWVAILIPNQGAGKRPAAQEKNRGAALGPKGREQLNKPAEQLVFFNFFYSVHYIKM